MGNLIKSFLPLLILIGSCMGQGGECPHGWSKWKDEKCYLLVDTYSTYASAKEACASNSGSLAQIKEPDQQNFLTNFIFNQSNVESGVWIGATRISGSETEFVWEDGTNVDYTYWGTDSPSRTIERGCVAMQSRLSKKTSADEDGKWKDVSCNLVNLILCETVPTWSLDEIMQVLIETRKKLDNMAVDFDSTKDELAEEKRKLDNMTVDFESTKGELAEEKRKVERLEKNPVPVGFLYYEHHGQPAPQALWPGVTWADVTSTYAGLFFRALGGGSAAFGSTQNADSPRLAQVETRHSQNYGYDFVANIPAGSWSGWIYTGNNAGGGGNIAHRHFVSNPEIRPKNAAIRIWKRQA